MTAEALANSGAQAYLRVCRKHQLVPLPLVMWLSSTTKFSISNFSFDVPHTEAVAALICSSAVIDSVDIEHCDFHQRTDIVIEAVHTHAKSLTSLRLNLLPLKVMMLCLPCATAAVAGLSVASMWPACSLYLFCSTTMWPC